MSVGIKLIIIVGGVGGGEGEKELEFEITCS